MRLALGWLSAPGATFNADANSRARSAAPRIGLIPEACERRSRFNRRHGEIELEPFGFSGERQTNRMKERLPFLTGALAHSRCRCAERLLVEQTARLAQFLGKASMTLREPIASARTLGSSSARVAE